MKNSHLLLAAFAAATCMGNLNAEPMNSHLTVGADYTRIHFKPNGEASFNGNMGGLHGLYEYRPDNAIYAAVKLNWRQGSMDGSAGRRTLADVDTAERVGYTWVSNECLFSLYSGLGYRYLGHHLHSSSSGTPFNGAFFPPFLSSSKSLKFDYNEFYVPVGFASDYIVNNRFSVGLNMEWRPQIFSTVKIRPLGGAYWSLKSTYTNFLVEVPFNFDLTKCGNWVLTASPFYERWQDGHSTAKTSTGSPLGLPENTYNFYGVDLNVTYAF